MQDGNQYIDINYWFNIRLHHNLESNILLLTQLHVFDNFRYITDYTLHQSQDWKQVFLCLHSWWQDNKPSSEQTGRIGLLAPVQF